MREEYQNNELVLLALPARQDAGLLWTPTKAQATYRGFQILHGQGALRRRCFFVGLDAGSFSIT
jgi:hypothetical protein